MKNELKYFILYKPFGVLCQFTDGESRETLAVFGPFPTNVYPVGRLDADSEGLVLLTNDGELKHHLIEPKYGHPRTYLAQVENVPSQEALEQLRNGVLIERRKTLPSEVTLLTKEPILPPRPVPIRYRKNIPTAWIKLTLSEGRNRQVRKMTAAVGHPTLRLIRISIGPITLNGLQPGESRELRQEELRELFKFVGIKKPASH
jgi:23S rRNA pseudouridine2457 synthase